MEDARTALAQANEVVMTEELKEISGMTSHEIVSRHVHKLVQVTFFLFLVSLSTNINYLS